VAYVSSDDPTWIDTTTRSSEYDPRIELNPVPHAIARHGRRGVDYVAPIWRKERALSRLIRPVLFSQAFSLDPASLKAADLVDPILNADTRLFVDPLLLSSSNHPEIRNEGFDLLKERFSKIVRLMAASRRIDDPAWKAADRLLDLSERPETGLGYGSASTSGSSRPASVKRQILGTAKEIIELGEEDPEIISLMGLFDEDVGPDTISDLTTTAILPVLCEITENYCARENIKLKVFDAYSGTRLPENPSRPGDPIVLVPRDIVRDLPLATDWSDVSRVVMEIAEIRDAFNNLIGPIAQATITEKKQALRKAALQSLGAFRELLSALRDSADNYDPNEDILNFYTFRRIISTDLSAFSVDIDGPKDESQEELYRIVQEIVAYFRHLIENNGLWELLWANGKPKRERAAQLTFFAIADVFCRANDLDISPETNAGGGPVDFKFSKGHSSRVLVEIKRSKGQVVHGYERQIKIYMDAARTNKGIFLIIDIGGMGKKLIRIQKIRQSLIEQGQDPPIIEVVDARPRESASKI